MQFSRRALSLEEIEALPVLPKNPWCVRYAASLKKEETAKARLFCFHHAGANSSTYAPWDPLLDANISLVSLELPGHLSRYSEKMITDMDDIVNQIVQGMAYLLDRPFFIFGHSLGATIGFEVVKALQIRWSISPLCLFVSGQDAPQFIIPDDPPVSSLSDRDLIKYLMSTYQDSQFCDVAKRYPDILHLILPVIRGDIKLHDNYVLKPGKLLRCPVILFVGEEDAISEENKNGWKIHSSLPTSFAIHRFPGGHFYLNDPKPLLQDLNKQMCSYLKRV